MMKNTLRAGLVLAIALGMGAGAQAAPGGVQLRLSASEMETLTNSYQNKDGQGAAGVMLRHPSSAEAIGFVGGLLSLHGNDDFSHLGTITLMAQNARIIEQNDRMIALLEKIAAKR